MQAKQNACWGSVLPNILIFICITCLPKWNFTIQEFPKILLSLFAFLKIDSVIYLFILKPLIACYKLVGNTTLHNVKHYSTCEKNYTKHFCTFQPPYNGAIQHCKVSLCFSSYKMYGNGCVSNVVLPFPYTLSSHTAAPPSAGLYLRGGLINGVVVCVGLSNMSRPDRPVDEDQKQQDAAVRHTHGRSSMMWYDWCFPVAPAA